MLSAGRAPDLRGRTVPRRRAFVAPPAFGYFAANLAAANRLMIAASVSGWSFIAQ